MIYRSIVSGANELVFNRSLIFIYNIPVNKGVPSAIDGGPEEQCFSRIIGNLFIAG